MKTRNIFLQSVKELENAGIDNPRIVVYNLMEKLLDISRHKILIDEDMQLKENKFDQYRDALERIISGEPLDYVVGRVNFIGIELKVDQRALIPRPETEALVDIVIEKEKSFKINFADIGTGSGVIAIALAKKFPKSLIYATDVSGEALDLAKENACINGVENIIFLEGDCLKPLMPYLEEIGVIVSNPPYIKRSFINKLDTHVKNYEPLTALNGGKDGLSFYKKLFYTMSNSRKKIYLEIADYSASRIASMAKKAGYFCEIMRDINDFRRYAVLFPVS
ncbi:MAG: peptide chain release factor N(5)-glutamine methyltransferase [Kosmotogaceae bacterium]